MYTTCPNCESKMNAGEYCPECDHNDTGDCDCEHCSRVEWEQDQQAREETERGER